jgi:pimeloyl-ACP methyl ester carboxylesterase
MSARTTGWVVVAAVISLGAGAALSHVIEPGVRVEKVMLTTNTPALRIFPATPDLAVGVTKGLHPIALLAHGGCGSKENLFRFGEALAAAGFDCYSVDQAGQGESPQRFSITNIFIKPRELERALGGVDVFIGHSLGGGAGAWSVREDGFRPKLFIALESDIHVGERGPPVVVLMARFGEFASVIRTWLRAQTNAQVVSSPWSEHITAAFDPVLARAAVKAACAAVGKPVPAAPTAWRWRFAGLVLGITGALVLMFRLPELHPRLARIRKFIVPGVLLLAFVLTLGTWVGVSPQLRRIPAHLVVLGVVWLALAGIGRLRMPRWSLPVVTGILGLCCFAIFWPTGIILFGMSMAILAISTLLLLPSVVVGRIAARSGSRRDGDIAMAIFASYVIGQFMPLFY